MWMRLNAGFGRGLVVTALVALSACTGAPEGVTVVRDFDAQRYMGTWYEIARLPNSFEKGLEQVTASYALNDDGTVRVVNRGFDVAKGEWREATGKARFVGDSRVAELEVSFFGPFYGGYNVVALGPDYDYSLVVGPNRSYLWILARQPTLAEGTLAALKRKAADLGYDTTALVYVPH
jgi:apolipoprotein D and lipocalin family protein